VPAAIASAPSSFEIEILSERRPALIASQSLHDPMGERMRRR